MPQRRPTRYYSSGAATGKDPFKRSIKRRSVWSMLADWLTVAAVVAAIAYSLFVGSKPEVTATSDAYRPLGAYQQAARSSFKHYANRNKLTLDEKGIIANLQGLFPEVSGGIVDLPLVGHTPTVRLEVPPPSFILNSNGKEYVVNSRGVAVAERSQLPRGANLQVVIDQSGFSADIGRPIMASGEVRFIEAVIKQCRQANVRITSLTLPPRAMELDLRTSDSGYYTKFYLGGDSLAQTGQFLAARRHFEKSGKKPAQYLDVRVPGKIYFK